MRGFVFAAQFLTSWTGSDGHVERVRNTADDLGQLHLVHVCQRRHREMPSGNDDHGRAGSLLTTAVGHVPAPVQHQHSETAPKLIIAQDSPRLGTNFSFGIAGNRACVCPLLVWTPDRRSFDPDYVYPLIEYIARNYHPVARIGGKVILEPNPP